MGMQKTLDVEKKLRPGGIVADRYNFDHWEEVFPDDDVKPVSCDSIFANGFETLLFLAKSIAECTERLERMRIVLDYDPQARKMLVTYFRSRDKRDNSEEA